MHRRVTGALLVAGFAMAGMAAQAGAPAVEARLSGLQGFTLEFAQSMQVWDNAVRTDVVRIAPSVPATCSWDSDTRLACHVDGKLAQATRYRLDIGPGLKTQAGAVLGAQTLSVETARPQAVASINGWDQGVPELQVWANMPVAAAALRSVLRLELDGRAIPMPELRALPPQWKDDPRTRFGFDAPRTQGGSHLLELRVKPGLRTDAGPLPGRQDDVLLRARINAPFALQGVVCTQDERVLAPVRNGVVDAHCLPGQPVHLVFSHPLDPQSREAVAMRVAQAGGPRLFDGNAREVSWLQRNSPFEEQGILAAPVDWSAIGDFAPGMRVELQLDDALRDERGARLPPVTVRIRMGDAQPQLRASHGDGLIADGSQVPTLVEAINAGDVVLDVRGVGAQLRDETVQVRSPRRDNVARPIASPVAAQTLAEGGWLRWTPQDKESGQGWRSRGPVDFAAPAFDLLALSGRREVLAWANEWNADAPVAGAGIELLWLQPGATQPRVVARGRTGSDGTVLLRLPDDVVVPGEADDAQGAAAAKPMWLLRASSPGAATERRAVLPMGDIDSYAALGQPDPRRMWGVSDRPLYHAGDTVHYRLWQREMDGTRLRAPRSAGALSLRLQNGENDKVVLEWQATPAADGSVAGDLTLPIHLTDATYCIGIDDGHENTDGSCFFVGTYRAQDLWLEAKSRGGVVRDGDRFVADVRAGYFSGGPAVGAEVTSATVTLWPEALDEAYPEYADFGFIEVDGDDVEYVELAGVDDYDALDGDGALRIDVPVAFEGTAGEIDKRPAFGVLSSEVAVAPEDREDTSASEQATRYARYDRYVGLRTDPEWFGADDPVRLEAVVITADGKEVAAPQVEVIVEYLTSWDRGQAGERIARCVLRTRQPAPCEFARQRSGIYRFTARSGTAAPATLERYVWSRGHALRLDAEPELVVLEASAQRDRPARVLVKQPFERARALFAITFGGNILSHRIETIQGNAQEVSLPLARDWRGFLQVKALVREAAAAKVDAGFRQPPRLESLEADLYPAPPAATATPPVRVRFQAAQAKPGTRARITLHNTSTQPRDVALAVMDDALRAQAQRWLPYADPMATGFRSLLERGSGGVRLTSFDEWTGEDWHWLLPWAEKGDDRFGATAGQARVQREVPAPAFGYAERGEATVLDRIEVTGSRIKRADIVESREAKAPDPSLRLDRAASHNASRPTATMVAARTRFADTALWLPEVRLAPGESRDIEVELPDNLTRWRAVAWSADAGDDFAMAEAALEVGLPVEARLQAPVRLYPGDMSRVATSVRHTAATPVTAQTTLQVHGEGANAGETLEHAQALALGARGQGSVATTLHPQATGALRLVATARTPAGGDAVAGTIEVASTSIATRKLQAGWLGEDTLRVALPPMPDHAHDPALHVALLRGNAGFTGQWTQDLRAYPHRCWEQTLSRAVGAALALERHDASWPDADAVVREALDNAAVFQLADGGFVYFASARDDGDASVPLTAYTLRAFDLLRTLGHPVPGRVEAHAREFLDQVLDDAPAANEKDIEGDDLAGLAFAAAVRTPEAGDSLDALWAHWKQLSLPVQVASAQAFARARHPAAARAVKRLLESAPVRGGARTLRLARRYDAWMSSDLREQCALIDLLRDQPQHARAYRELLAGMGDLYAGGVASVDTQTGAYCLMALRDPAQVAAAPARAHFTVGSREQLLELAPGQARADWDVGTPEGSQLQVAVAPGQAVPVSYVAELDYLEDAGSAKPSAVGLSIERRHAVLRDGAWKPVAGETLHEGDWIRTTLIVRTSAAREFVALTDDVAGGLQPTDLALSGVGNAELKRIADEGSGHFATRRLDARHPRFYAESLPAGVHEVHYFARVGNSGDYLAAPAVAELMYGAATYARTAATRLRVEDSPPARK